MIHNILLVFRAENAREIEERLRADPWTRSGILSTTRIVRWHLSSGGRVKRGTQRGHRYGRSFGDLVNSKTLRRREDLY
jgi:hypothetical protein